MPDVDDYFILKPQHSAFYCTSLEAVLRSLAITRVIVCGFAGDMCVQFTANDAYMRGLRISVPADCCASSDEADNQAALHLMRKALKADTAVAAEVDLTQRFP